MHHFEFYEVSIILTKITIFKQITQPKQKHVIPWSYCQILQQHSWKTLLLDVYKWMQHPHLLYTHDAFYEHIYILIYDA